MSVQHSPSRDGPQTGQSAAFEKRSTLMFLLIKFKTYASPVINFTLFGCHCQWHMILDATQPNEKLRSKMWYIAEISPIREMHFEWDHCNCIWHTSFHPHLSSLASDDGRCAWLNGGDVTAYKVRMLSEWLQVTSFFSGWIPAVVYSLCGHCIGKVKQLNLKWIHFI